MLASPRGTASYLFYYAANAAMLPMLALYYQSRGMDGLRLGLLTALMPAGMMIGSWLWGAVADGTGRHRLVLACIITGSAAVAQTIPFARTFLALVPSVALFALVTSSIASLLDHGVLQDLQGRTETYGKVRLWGAVGWGITAPIAGVFFDRFDLGLAFPMYGILMIGLLVVSLRLPTGASRDGADLRGGFREVRRSGAWRRFLLIVFAAGTGSTMMHHNLFVYFESIGATGVLAGLSLTVGTASEFAVFALGPRLLRRFRPERLMIVAMAAIAVRLLLYALIRNPILALAPQLLHGFTFSLLLLSGVETARRLAPKGMEATAQTIFGATQMGAAGIAGALIAGVLFRSMSPGVAFGWTGIALAVAALVARITEPARHGSGIDEASARS